MIDLTINGKTQRADANPATPLLYVLRNDLQMNGAISIALSGRPARQGVDSS